MPALLTSTSRPPSPASVATSPSAAASRTAAGSTSQTCTCAPRAANARATARPIPLAAAVIATRTAIARLSPERALRGRGGVLLLGHVLAPGGGEAVVSDLDDRQVRHEPRRRGAV